MKITHLVGGRCSGESANGVDRSIVQFARHQARLGHEVKLMGITHKDPYPVDGVDSVTSPPGITPFFPSRETRAEILRGQPDLLHLHGAYVPIYPGIAQFARKVGLPYVITPHGNYSPLLLKRQPLVKKLYRRFMELPMAERALFVHAIADEKEIRAYGVNGPVVSAVNGMELSSEANNRDRVSIRKSQQLPGDARIFLFLGRLDVPQKGLDLMLAGFASFLERLEVRKKAHLVMAGPAWDGSDEKLARLAGELGMADSVSFPGGVFGEDKKDLIACCDFFVHPSRWEAGVPFAVLEALAQGKQCLVSSVVDRDGALKRAGVCQVAELDEDDIAVVLGSMFRQSEDELSRRAVMAREIIREKFSGERAAQTLVEGYRKFLQRRNV